MACRLFSGAARLQIMCLLVVGVALGHGPGAWAAEVDSVTPRRATLADSLDRLNDIFNARLAEGVAQANARQGDYADMASDELCDQEILYTELRKALFQSWTASWGLKGYSLDKQLRELLAPDSYSLPLADSIYQDISYLEGFSLNLKELSHLVSINGHLVGLDKIGHFFSEGWHYFERSDFQAARLDTALAWGKTREAGTFGYTTTGIFSYSDLVANFNGWRFWNRVLGHEDDPLKGFWGNLVARPYVSCDIQFLESLRHGKVVRAWEVKRRFDLADYVDGAWDENNNCNRYKDQVIGDKVQARIAEVDADFHCPARPEECRRARRRYGAFARDVLHPRCLAAANE